MSFKDVQLEHIDLDTKDLEDEVWEPILYLPRAPSTAMLVDGLIVKPTADGQWEAPDDWVDV